MKIIVSIVISILLSVVSSCIYAQSEYEIDELPMTWNNFSQIHKRYNNSAVAQTYIKINVKRSSITRSDRIELSIDLEMTQEKEHSWVSRQFLRNENESTIHSILNHERLHLAINLIHFRFIYLELSKYHFTEDYRSEITEIVNSISESNETLNQLYDIETYHGTNHNAQIKWETDVMQVLNSVYPQKTILLNRYNISKIIYIR